MQYTPAQQCAIAFPDENLLLSAAAGSGKTATLTARILALLEGEKARLSQMLIVTYTRAAAAELRERIGKKITEAAKSTGSRKMARHLTDLPGADISTIHAFLYRTLRPSFAALGLSPDFTIGDEAVIDTLRQDAMRDTLDDFFAAGDADFLALADTLAGTRDALSLDRTLLHIYASITAAGQEPVVLHQYAEELKNADDFFAMPQSEPIRRRLLRSVSHYRQVIFSLRTEFTEAVAEKYGETADGLLEWLSRAETEIRTGSYREIREILASYEPIPLKRLKPADATPESDAFKAAREEWKTELSRFRNRFFADPEELVTRSLERTAALLETCSRVLNAYAQAFRQRKHARSLLDYNDLETLALRLFLDEEGNPTREAEEVGSRYRYIFVDEYQDTNRVQDAIFRALGRHVPRFMVGDSKQSIYRFRGAEPSVFAEYRDTWPVYDTDSAGGGRETGPDAEQGTAGDTPFSPEKGHCLFMSENFRCDKPVVDFVNLVSDFLFPHSRMPYTGEDALVFGKGEGTEAPAEVVLIEKSGGEEDDPDRPEKRETADERGDGTETDPEAEYVADRIAAMLGGAEKAPDGQPLTPDDIAILLRSPDTGAAPFRDALARRGIPVRLQNTERLFTSPVILLTVCLAHVADNPLHDIPTAGAMHSPLFGFGTHDLVTLRGWSRAVLRQKYNWEGDMPLYYIVRMAVEEDWDFAPLPEETETVANATECAEDIEEMSTPWDTELPAEEETEVLPELPPELVEKCRIFFRGAEELRQMAHGMRADRFLDELYRRYALFDLPEIAASPVEKNNLLALYDLARRYESGQFGGVGGFLTYAEELQEKERERGTADALPAVTILSIHKSKGLEFPVVFVSACSKKRNTRDEEGDILYDPDLGFGMRLPDEGGHARCGTALRSAIAEKKRLDAVEEEMRVVYVALTRARNRLIITGKTGSCSEFLESCRRDAVFATDHSVTGNTTYLRWILTAALRHGPDPCWRLLTVTEQDAAASVSAVAAEPEQQESGEEKRSAAQWEELLADNLDFRYAWDHLAGVPAKLTVSRLHGAVLDEEDGADGLTWDGAAASFDGTEDAADTEEMPPAIPMPRPRFMDGAPSAVTAADRGTATHLFLQFADFAALREHGVRAELTRLTEQHFLSDQTAGLVYIPQLERFRESELFARMCVSPLCRREFRFNVPMEAWRFTKDPVLAARLREEGAQLIVQGVVDCVFRDTDGGLTLVDYKTDRPLQEEYENPALADIRFARRHSRQLGYYREICSAMFAEKIAKTVIYSTALAREIPVTPEE